MSKGGGSVFDTAALFGGGGESSLPSVKKNKVSLCSACFNNFHKFSSERKEVPSGRKREEERDKWRFGVKEERAPLRKCPMEMSEWTECRGAE